MSIILGLICDKFGIVASDGRQFDPAEFTKGQLTKKAAVQNEEFDKTFEIPGYNIIGAFAGLTSFHDKTISEHIIEIVDSELTDDSSTDIIIDQIKNSLRKRLENINSKEVLFKHRKVNLIFIGKFESRRGATIKRFTIKPNDANDEIIIDDEKFNPPMSKIHKQGYWSTYGDDHAQKCTNTFLQFHINSLSKIGLKVLIIAGKRAIKKGVECCEEHEYGDELSCGGKTFVRKIKF